MHLVLSKHHGLGNDFLVCDTARVDPGIAWPELARRLCARTTGVGADGLLLLGIEGPSRLTMRLFNADGSEAEMSGNGIRCLVQAAHHALAGEVGAVYEVDTAAGRRTAEVLGEMAPHTLEIRVDMGPVTELPEPAGWGALECDPLRPVRHLSLGNPHSVVGVEDVAVIDLARLGALVPDVNLEIVEPGPGTDALTMRVHERGVGLTSACGTGACAAAAAALAWGIVPASVGEVTVHMDGGSVRVRMVDGRAVLTGPATWVGTVTVAT
ncbi:MAG: diaminopimelate epimerase [Actinomycetota bacterium]|jgi:diaminopimelate epimerase